MRPLLFTLLLAITGLVSAQVGNGKVLIRVYAIGQVLIDGAVVGVILANNPPIQKLTMVEHWVPRTYIDAGRDKAKMANNTKHNRHER